MRPRKYTEEELREILEESSFSESGGSSDNFEPDKNQSSSSSDDDDDTKAVVNRVSKTVANEVTTAVVTEFPIENTNEFPMEVESQYPMGVQNESPIEAVNNEVSTSHSQPQNTIWSPPDRDFNPKKFISQHRPCTIASNINKNYSPVELFHKLFPRSLYIYIAQCTNERISFFKKSNLNQSAKTNKGDTDAGEIEMVIGCMLVMCYNRLPSISDYWSQRNSMGNESIKTAMSRDRYLFLSSKLYFAPPEKPQNCSKTYYISDIVTCLKETYRKCRQDSVFQSIDESMTKFKGRSTLKQYMPLKPVKRGIKMWLRCDAITGYTYDFNIYTGKEQQAMEGTLGERVVNKLASTVSEPDVTFCFDRFFTSVCLLETLDYAALGTCMANRKNLPKFPGKLQRGESEFKVSSSGLLCAKWMDTKEVMVLSNCHKPDLTYVTITKKDGSKMPVPCPEMISFYRQIMGGVDLADQLSGIYEYDRKSTKWWKKIFYRLLMMTVVNAWIIHCEVGQKKTPLKEFLVSLAEMLIADGKKTAKVQRKKVCLPRGSLGNVSLHLPIETNARRRCTSCSKKKNSAAHQNIVPGMWRTFV